MASDSVPYHAPPTANPAVVNDRLSELPYGDESPIVSNAQIPSIQSEDDIRLYRNLVAGIGSALPAGEPQPEDSDTGNSKMSSVIGAVSLFGTIMGNLTDEKGRMSGDITLVITGRNGVPTSWKILLTAFLPGKAKENFDLNQDQARQFLADNKDALVKAGKYDEIAHDLGMQ